MKLLSATLLAFSMLLSGRAHAGPEDDVRASFDRFVVAQNAHDIGAVRDLLLDAPTFLWITRGTPNLKTAKALGLTIPPSLLGRADELIR